MQLGFAHSQFGLCRRNDDSGREAFMSRWIPVLITLLAQVVAMASPACFVRCTGVDGHVCLELAGQSCHCCETATDDDHKHDGKQVAGCCVGHQHHQRESQDRCSTTVL